MTKQLDFKTNISKLLSKSNLEMSPLPKWNFFFADLLSSSFKKLMAEVIDKALYTFPKPIFIT